MFKRIKALCVVMLAVVMAVATFAPAAPTSAQGQASGVIGNAGAQLYAGPGTGFWRLGLLRAKLTIPVIGVSADRGFWLVETALGQGFVLAEAITVSGGESVPVVDPGVIGTVTSSGAVVRSGPGPDAGQLAVLRTGEQFFVIGAQPDGRWIEIRYRRGIGWVASFLTSLGGEAPVEPSTDGPLAVTRGNVILRSGPGTQYTALGTLGGNAEVEILGRNNSGAWVFIIGDEGEGWVRLTSLRTTNYFGDAPVISPEETGAELDFTATTRTSVNVRSGPNLAFDSLGTLPLGTEVTVLGQSPDKAWWYCETSFGKGWINKSVIRTKRDYSSLPVIQ
jgi:uncharacterized protein YraI